MKQKFKIEKFGGKLKKARETIGISQKELAARIKVTPTTISAYEKRKKFPTLENAAAIANELNVSIDELCGGTTPDCKTYSDVIQCLILAADSPIRNFFVEIILTLPDAPTLINPDARDETMIKFIEDWIKVIKLYYHDGVIDDELYTAWKEKQLRDYDFPIKEKGDE